MGACVKCKKTKIRTFSSSQSIIKSENSNQTNLTSKLLSLLPINDNNFIDSNSKYDNPENYIEVESIAKGSHGSITKMKHRLSEQVIVEKREDVGSSYKFVENEASILKMLHHPKICRLKRVKKDDVINSLILDYFPQGTLETTIKNEEIGEPAAISIIHQMLDILSYIHLVGVYHRDIRPDNILVEPITKTDYDVKLINFSVACFAVDQDDQLKAFGNSLYFAPEKWLGIKTEKSDVWSLGIVLYYMMFKTFPYPENPIEYIEVDLNNIDCSNALKDLISQMLTINYRRRPEASKLLNHEWFSSYKNNSSIRKKLISSSSVGRPKVLEKLDSKSPNSSEIFKLNKEFLKKLMQNLVNYKPGNKIQQNVIALIVHNLGYSQEKQELVKVFNMIDSKSKGRLDIEDLRQAMLWSFDKVTVEDNLEIIFKRLDRNSSQYIEIDEFLQATISKDKLLSKEVIVDIFYFLCDNQNGIGLEVIKEKFNIGDKIARDMWRKFAAKHDKDEDGVLNFEEFWKLMKGMMSEC